MKSLSVFLPLILIDTTYGGLRTWNNKENEVKRIYETGQDDRLLKESQTQPPLTVPPLTVPPLTVPPLTVPPLTVPPNQEQLSVLIRVKEGKFEEVLTELEEKEDVEVSSVLDRPGIINAKIPQTFLDVLKSNDKIDKVSINSRGGEGVYTDDKPPIPEGPTSISENKGRKLQAGVPNGVEMVLQDLEFWNALPDPNGNIKVCIASSGVELGHSGLPQDYISGTDNPSFPSQTWNTDIRGDGTRMAGVIAGTGESRGIIPNNYNNNFQLVIANAMNDNEGSSWNEVMAGVETCVQNGAKVIVMSFVFTDDPSCEVAEAYFRDLYENEDILLIAPSGDFGDNMLNYIANGYKYPASFPTVMSVAAADHNENIAHFATTNDQIELAAPGVDIITTDLDNDYDSFNGTLLAAPHVAGVAGLLWMYYPECTNYQIRNVLAATAKSINGFCCNDAGGHGIIQAKDAYNLLAEGNCGGAIGTIAVGGCNQLQTIEDGSCVPVVEEGPPCETVIPGSRESGWLAAPGENFECFTAGNCCPGQRCCGYNCRNPDVIFSCERKSEKHEMCADVRDCVAGLRCWWVYYEGVHPEQYTVESSRPYAGEFGGVYSGSVSKVCYDQPKAVGEPCERGADCATNTCNNETKTCQYSCLWYEPGVNAHVSTGMSVDSDAYQNIGIDYSGTCDMETERCGYSVLSGFTPEVYGSCEAKYELGLRCDRDDDCLSGSCRGDLLSEPDENWEGLYYSRKTCRGPHLDNGEQCNDRWDCASDICSPETGLCAIPCSSHDECSDIERCYYGTGDNNLGIERYCGPKFELGESCISAEDCVSDRCWYVDGQAEKECTTKLPGGEGCTFGTDCESGNCVYMNYGNRCEYTPAELKNNGESCDYNEQCADGRCDPPTGESTCRAARAQIGQPCQDEYDCESDLCLSGTCKQVCVYDSDCDADTQYCYDVYPDPRRCELKGENGASCTSNADCASGLCGPRINNARICRDPPAELGASCQENSGCASNYCDSDICKQRCYSVGQSDACTQEEYYCKWTYPYNYCEPKEEIGASCPSDDACISGRCDDVCIDPNAPSRQPTPIPTRHPTRAPTSPNASGPAPTDTVPAGINMIPNKGLFYNSRKTLGSTSSVEDCVEAARNDDECIGNAIAHYGSTCRCSTNAACPPPSSSTYTSSIYNIYEYCGTDSPTSTSAPSVALSTTPSSSPTKTSAPSVVSAISITRSNGYCASLAKYISGKSSLEECVAAAIDDPACSGIEAVWNPVRNHCYCCSSTNSCPESARVYRNLNDYHTYEYERCE